MAERYPHPVSRNTTRKRLVSLWRWCRDAHYLPRDAKTEAEFTGQAQEANLEIGIIDHGTFARLLHYFRQHHPEYLAPLAIAGFAGLRRSEIHAQLWEDVDLATLHIRVTVAKRNTPAKRLVEIAPAAREWLMLVPERTGRVCPNASIDRIRNIARTAKDAGDNALFPPIPDNAFRHSFISHRVAATGDIPRTSLEAGNSVKIVNQHYRQLVKRQDGEAWFAIRPGDDALAPVVPMKEASA
jgi:integrase